MPPDRVVNGCEGLWASFEAVADRGSLPREDPGEPDPTATLPSALAHIPRDRQLAPASTSLTRATETRRGPCRPRPRGRVAPPAGRGDDAAVELALLLYAGYKLAELASPHLAFFLSRRMDGRRAARAHSRPSATTMISGASSSPLRVMGCPHASPELLGSSLAKRRGRFRVQ
jgi:hypothetical protein